MVLNHRSAGAVSIRGSLREQLLDHRGRLAARAATRPPKWGAGRVEQARSPGLDTRLASRAATRPPKRDTPRAWKHPSLQAFRADLAARLPSGTRTTDRLAGSRYATRFASSYSTTGTARCASSYRSRRPRPRPPRAPLNQRNGGFEAAFFGFLGTAVNAQMASVAASC
jgi:hypothetical protein